MKDWHLEAAILTGLALALLCGCAGPSKARYKILLSECRQHEREYVRLLKETQTLCPNGAEQGFGTVGFGEGGH